MGWCSGTNIFDSIVETVIESCLSIESTKNIIKTTIIALEYEDWDTQNESEYFNVPIVKDIFRELHPDWFEDE